MEQLSFYDTDPIEKIKENQKEIFSEKPFYFQKNIVSLPEKTIQIIPGNKPYNFEIKNINNKFY